jgi:hypothetical protein
MSIAKSQMSKHISKIKGGASSKKAAKKGGANVRKIGESTAKRMQEKARARPKNFEEEIDSDLGDDEVMGDVEAEKKRLGKSIESDPFFTNTDAAEQERNETLEERRLRMTKALLEELQQPTA